MTDTSNPAVPAQEQYLLTLAANHTIYGPEVSTADTVARMKIRLAQPLTSEQAADLIYEARRAARRADYERRVTAKQVEWLRKAATKTAMYGLTVDVDETVARVEAAMTSPHWSLAEFHVLRRLVSLGAPHPTAQTPLRLSEIEGIEDISVSEGHYAVFDADDVLRFYRIYTPETGTNQGEGVIRRFAGDNLMGLYPEEARLALTTINADPDVAAYRFSDTFTRCWVCGRNLTDAVSRLLSVGPTCRGFANHTGLRNASGEVDHDPARREVFRALRTWAFDNGFIDPRSKEDRVSITMSASRVASAWSGIPGILGMPPAEAVVTVTAALSGAPLSENVQAGLRSAPTDTLLLLIESGVLSTEVLQFLVTHPRPPVSRAANLHFIALLSGNL